MAALDLVDTSRLLGYRWMPSGQSALGVDLLQFEQRLDDVFRHWAKQSGASEWRFPVFLPARELDRLDYFRSFPHLVTFPVALDPEAKNLEAFTRGTPVDAEGQLHLTATQPIRDVLTPAACYHFYIQFQNENLSSARAVTTRAACFRREDHYLPLQRQWNFSMREIVCIGTEEEVKGFLQALRDRVNRFAQRARLGISWQPATDPFFNPTRNPKHLAQRLDPVKTEMIFRENLAIGSVNFHRNYFGETFKLRRSDADAYSGCVAFGLERWIYAWAATHGLDPTRWPDPWALESPS